MPQAPWAASAVEARAVAALLPYAGNARTHSAEQVAQIAASILEFGFVAPVLVDERGEIIAGHGRLLAAQSLGLDAVPTIVRAGLTEAQKAAYRLADNRIALNAGWDEALLAAEVAKLQDMGGVDLALTGFDAGELDGCSPGWRRWRRTRQRRRCQPGRCQRSMQPGRRRTAGRGSRRCRTGPAAPGRHPPRRPLAAG